jgi:protein TonB
MLTSLVESGHRPGAARRAVPTTLVSALFHGGVLAGAVALTMPAPLPPRPIRPVIGVLLPAPTRDPGPPAPAAPAPLGAPKLSGDVPIPDFRIPNEIPPIDLGAPPIAAVPVGKERAVDWGPPGGSPDVGPARTWIKAEVDEPPELVSAPDAVYPRLLRDAGVEGTVVIEAVIGIDGRPERESVRVISATRREFERPALDMVQCALFRPGRVRGEKVRVLVRLPISFRLAQ